MALNQLLRLNCIDNCHAIEVDIYSPWEASSLARCGPRSILRSFAPQK